MPSIERPYTLRTPIGVVGKTNKSSPSKEGGKYLTSHTFIVSKSIVVKLDLDLLLDLVNFNALTIFNLNIDE
jgi:hypothetical protein